MVSGESSVALEQIQEIQASRDRPDRIAKQIAKRERQIVESRRMLATSSFNVAVAAFNLARKDEARQGCRFGFASDHNALLD